MKVSCICIDAKNRPLEVPLNMWISEGIEYNIIHVYYSLTSKLPCVELEEVQMKNCQPYEYYRLTRFAFREEDLKKLIELMKACTELNDVDINKLIEESQLEKIEI